jgi:hypothetical protein
MHHYGEDGVEVDVNDREFKIILRNHETGAEIIISGPSRGVFDDPNRAMDQHTAEGLGREVAHKLRERLIVMDKRMLTR